MNELTDFFAGFFICIMVSVFGFILFALGQETTISDIKLERVMYFKNSSYQCKELK